LLTASFLWHIDLRLPFIPVLDRSITLRPLCLPHSGHILKRLFVGNLPSDATETSVTTLFSEFGKVHSIELVIDMFSGKCRGFGYVGMEGHEARAAIAKLSGAQFGGNALRVSYESTGGKSGRRR
jgi:cleavage stimulation factor subunit 2